MFANLKKALVVLYSIETFTSSEGSEDFKRLSAFLGKIKDVAVSALASFLLYLTNL